jgi:hypothetical protein
MPSKAAVLLAFDACLSAGPMPAEPGEAMHAQCDAWAVVEARRINAIAQADGVQG